MDAYNGQIEWMDDCMEWMHRMGGWMKEWMNGRMDG